MSLAACDAERTAATDADEAQRTPATPPDTSLAEEDGAVPVPPPPAGLNGEAEQEENGGAREVSAETPTYVFEYSWPAEAGAIPELADLLDRRLASSRESLAKEAADGQQRAREIGFPFNKYSSGTRWQVVTDLPDWLSLSATQSIYTGGAHPNYGFEALVWDKTRRRSLEPAAMFTSLDDLDRALGADLCKQLEAERAKRRGPDAGPDAAAAADAGAGAGSGSGAGAGGTREPGIFDQCVSVDETSILPGSRGGKKFDRLGIQIAPYVAGPYSEGVYEFTFPVTAELLETVRPQYRDAFVARN